jgi:RNA polymerase sigma-70 factor (ECF subfamily)
MTERGRSLDGEARPGDGEWSDLRSAADGDQGAFERVVRRHQERLHRLCLRMLHDPGEAEEAVQEVFLKVYRRARALEPRGQLYTLLYRVASNHCLNVLRRRRIVRFLPLLASAPAAEEGAGPGVAADPADPAPDAPERIDSARRWRQVRRGIERLPPSQRAVLVLVKLEGLSYREAADTLAITVGAVESRLFRAMRSLEAALEEALSFEEDGR